MLRYVTLLWNESERSEADAAQAFGQRLRGSSTPWREAFCRPGVRVLCACSDGLDVHLLPNGAGVVLGALFDRNRDCEDETPSSLAQLTVEAADAVVATRGRWLVERCWGDYVAFIVPRSIPHAYILKDPTGSLPAFATTHRRVRLFFSCIADCLDAGLQFTLNPAYLESRVVVGATASRLQPLNEVVQIHRGECVEADVRDSAARLAGRFAWRPTQFASCGETIDDPATAARALRATVRNCTGAWSARYSSMLHRLSGGLDSAIVAGCLSQAPSRPQVTCYTYYNPGGRSDERPWAQLAARHAAAQHVLCPLQPERISLASAGTPIAVEPASFMTSHLRTTVEAPLARARQASAVFSGDGGDSNFCSDSVSYAATDYLRRQGPRPGLWRLAADVGLATSQTAWSVLVRSTAAWLFDADHQPRRRLFTDGLRLLSPELRESFDVAALCPHPWFESERRVPWATAIRLGGLLCTPDLYYVGDLDAAPAFVAPLYSQPVVELCLRIPSYVHFEDGQDRGLARRAFAEQIPHAIRTRLWKDRAPGFHETLLRRNREFLCDTFLDGVLVGKGLLDRTAVEREFVGSTFGSRSSAVEILRHLDVELWAQRWTRTAGRRMAA